MITTTNPAPSTNGIHPATAGLEGIREQRVLMTPEYAQKLLDNNPSNRKVSQDLVDRYARDMACGDFPYIADPVKVGSDGVLQDGQQRLLAVVQSRVTMPMLLVTGLPPEVSGYHDQGRPRSAADQLVINGHTNVLVKSGIARMLIEWDHDAVVRKDYRVTNMQVVRFVEEYEGEMVNAASAAAAVRTVVPFTPAVAGAAYFKMSRVNGTAAGLLFDKIRTGAALEPGDPILALRNHMLGGSHRDRRIRINRVEQLYFLAVTWEDWVAQDTVHRLQVPKGGVKALHIPMIVKVTEETKAA